MAVKVDYDYVTTLFLHRKRRRVKPFSARVDLNLCTRGLMFIFFKDVPYFYTDTHTHNIGMEWKVIRVKGKLENMFTPR